MARAFIPKTEAQFEDEQWVKDKMATLEKLANLTNEVKQLREELDLKVNIIMELEEENESLKRQMFDINSKYNEITNLEAQVDVLKELIKEMTQDK